MEVTQKAPINDGGVGAASLNVMLALTFWTTRADPNTSTTYSSMSNNFRVAKASDRAAAALVCSMKAPTLTTPRRSSGLGWRTPSSGCGPNSSPIAHRGALA